MKIQVWVDGQTFSVPNSKVVYYSVSQRLQRALRTATLFLVAALFSILIPVLHFVLVPSFLITAIVMFITKIRQVSYIEIGEFACPKCSQPLVEKQLFQREGENESRVYCYTCRDTLTFEILTLVRS